MNGRERVVAALRRQAVDRAPVCNPTSVATIALMDLVDAPFPDACRNPDLIARLAATGYTELGFDSVMPVFSVVQESSALGCKIRWEEKDWPTVVMSEPIWRGPEDIRIPSDLLSHPDMKSVLDAIRILRKQFGNEVAIIGKVMGPWTLCYHCFGLEHFLLMTAEDPDKTRLCLERLQEVTIQFGIAQAEAGADALTLPDHASGELVSPNYYLRYLRDLHHNFADRIPAPLILHICGRTLDRMEYIAQTGMAAFHFDSKNEPAKSMAVVRGRLALVGSINNPETLLRRGPAEVWQEVYRNLDAGIPLIAPECAVPLQTPTENLKQIPKAVAQWHREQGVNP
jgi:MtaA/CmuA family methyltransferase